MRAYEVEKHTETLCKIEERLLNFMKTNEFLKRKSNTEDAQIGDMVLVQDSFKAEIKLPSYVCRGLITGIKKEYGMYYIILLVDHGISIGLTRDKFHILPKNLIPDKYLTKTVGVYNIIPICMRKSTILNGCNTIAVEKILVQSSIDCDILCDITDLRYPKGIHQGWDENIKSSRPRKLQSYIWPAINNGLNVVAIGSTQCGKTSGCVMAVCGQIALRLHEIRNGTQPLALILCASSCEVISVQSLCESFLRTFTNIKCVAAFNGKSDRSVARKALELERNKKVYALCDNVKSFGFCRTRNVCVFRHCVLSEIDAPMTNIQMKMSTSTNVGDICVLEETIDTFKRVQITRIKYDRDYSEDEIFVDVRCIDSGIVHEYINVRKLMHIPKELLDLPTHIVEIFLTNLIPWDEEYMWNHYTNEQVHKWFSENFDERSYIIGEVHLHLGNTIWLDDLKIGTKLIGHHDLIGSSLKKELCHGNYSIVNNNHLSNLFKLCRNSGMTEINGHNLHAADK
ncbi:Tudor domain-containing protein 12 [Acromyrmex echinatior]|uniref:RNA helicase n=1 Tax=Acromyrmex echinatior TaxID=103372 RepID=F4W8F2_ACREC|nr:Tudor domain-containing protein 12 [Acromyrmex echinatior]